MALINNATCAVCFENKGVYSKSLLKITPALVEKIRMYVWAEYDPEKNICPEVICSNCRRNLFSLDKNKTDYLAQWMDKISKVEQLLQI
jgi:hypothetical protein